MSRLPLRLWAEPSVAEVFTGRFFVLECCRKEADSECAIVLGGPSVCAIVANETININRVAELLDVPREQLPRFIGWFHFVVLFELFSLRLLLSRNGSSWHIVRDCETETISIEEARCVSRIFIHVVSSSHAPILQCNRSHLSSSKFPVLGHSLAQRIVWDIKAIAQ